ncbi:MAG: hypothetical protein H7A54_16880 [Akkermansiaceae bacterium]|nr:hypothetical protein [Akkermansiaceae bacterium]
MKLRVLTSFLIAVTLLGSSTRALAEEPLIGVFGENSMQRVLDYEAWLGRKVDVILCTVDFQKWENYRYADWLSQTVYGERGTRRLVYDVPIIIEGASYAEAKTGAYEEHWRCLAESIVSNNPGEFDIVIRPSHEMNGDWFPWCVGGSRQAMIPNFRPPGSAFTLSSAAWQAVIASVSLSPAVRRKRSTPDVAWRLPTSISSATMCIGSPRPWAAKAGRQTIPKEAWGGAPHLMATMPGISRACSHSPNPKENPSRSMNGVPGARMRMSSSRGCRHF